MQPSALKKFVVVFCVTDLCDKRCPSCCTQAMRKGSVMDFIRYKQKLAQVAAHCQNNRTQPVIAFTGGESFLYLQRGPEGARRTLADMVDSAVRIVPGAQIFIKTSGFQPNAYLDGLLEDVLTSTAEEKLRIRLGFSLHQKGGGEPRKRLTHMLRAVLSHRAKIDVDVIYDKRQMRPTLEVVSKALAEAGFSTPLEAAWEAVLADPCVAQERVFMAAGKTVVVATEPAYRPEGCNDLLEYFDEKIVGTCQAFYERPEGICYRPDFSIIHCNDSYVDFGIKAPAQESFETIADEISFVRARFAALRPIMAQQRTALATKRDACKFCTNFVLGGDPREVSSCRRV